MKKFIRIFFEEIWSFYQTILLFFPTGRFGYYTRGFLLGIFFKKKGRMITIKENVEIYHPHNLSIGNKSGIGRNNVIDAIGGIDIGNNVRLGPNVMISTMNHAKKGGVIGKDLKERKNVIIKDNVWIGNGVTIVAGVTIGNNVIIGAGSVVTKNIPDNSTVVGIPASKI